MMSSNGLISSLPTVRKQPRRSLIILTIALSCSALLAIVLESGLWSARRRDTPSKIVVLDAAANIAAETRRPEAWKQATTLIMVAGHAVFTGNRLDPEGIRNESNWYLESFQHGQLNTFIEHIKRGVELAANDTHALLMFSGGQTRPAVGPRSEGSSYWLAAEAFDWFGYEQVKERAVAEEYARDSLENLLFSVCRFRQLTGNYPTRIIVVSFGFKQLRFEELHRKALQYPKTRFRFVGVDPDGDVDGMRDSLSARERSASMGPFAGDLYGCTSLGLFGKRLDRNPLLRFHPYPQGCPEIADLVHHCGRNVYTGPLPWPREAR